MGYTVNEDGSVTRDRTPKTSNTSKGSNSGCWIFVLIAVIVGIIIAVSFANKNSSSSNNSNYDSHSTIIEDEATEPMITDETAEPMPQKEESKVNSDPRICLEGTIGPYGIGMTLYIDPNGEVKGAYFYKRQGEARYMLLKGHYYNDKSLVLEEYERKGDKENTAYFEGEYRNGIYTGTFYVYSTGDEYYFNIKQNNKMTPLEIFEMDYSGIN